VKRAGFPPFVLQGLSYEDILYFTTRRGLFREHKQMRETIDPENSNFKNRKIRCRIKSIFAIFGDFLRIFPKHQSRHRQKTGDDSEDVPLSYDILFKRFPF